MSSDLQVNNGAAGQATVFGVRGMMNTAFTPAGDSLVATHIDGAYLANVYALNGLLFDVDRVESLAGPQGTLYGKNTAAGAVNILTRRPGRDFEANGLLEYGSKNTVRVGGGVTIPMGDSLSMRVSGQKYTRDSFFTDGSGENDQWGARLSSVWNVSERDTLFIQFDKVKYDTLQEGQTLYRLSGNPNAVIPGGGVPLSISLYQNLATLGDPFNDRPFRLQRNEVFTGNSHQSAWGGMLEYTREFDPATLTLQL